MKFRLLAMFFILSMLVTPALASTRTSQENGYRAPKPETYTPKFDEFNVKEQMTLSPLFTPDNALYIYSSWLKKANTSIDLQNQYITKFDSGTWDDDSNPIVREIVNAIGRGVNVRVQVRGDSDSDDVTSYLQSKGASVRWMGDSTSNPDGDYLSATHNKLIIIDEKVILISSINFGKNAFTNNREAGMVIQNAAGAAYFTSIFNSDWTDGEQPLVVQRAKNERSVSQTTPDQLTGYPSHTNIPRQNFTGVYNISLYANPDNADEVIFRALKNAKESVYVSMYTISRPDFNNTLIDLKKANPSIDIRVLISNRRVGGTENRDTYAAALSLVKNFIPVYNSTKDDDKVDGFYHNKYWIIDGKHTFIYSGNWSPRSVTPQGSSYTSGEANRDMGVVAWDAPDIAEFVKNEVWEKDVAVADAWDLPLGVAQSSFTEGEIVSGLVNLKAAAFGLTNVTLSYSFGTKTGNIDGSSMDVGINTLDIGNGITTFKVTATSDQGTYTDEVMVTIANYDQSENFRVLITEFLPNPAVVSDSQGEYIQISNSFPFDVLLSGWKLGTVDSLLTFSDGYSIPAYSSVVVARSSSGLMSGYGVSPDFELSFSLTNSKGEVVLYDIFGTIVDDVAYGTATAQDGSETVSAPGAGEAIARSPMHLDTNKASDFTFTAPNPKGAVASEPLSVPTELQTGSTTTTTSTDSTLPDLGTVPFNVFVVFMAIVIVPIIRRRR